MPDLIPAERRLDVIISWVIILLIFLALAAISASIIVRNNKDFNDSCSRCPYKKECKSKKIFKNRN